MTFSQDVWQRNHDLYQKILALPFNQELAKGTLDRKAFCHYVIQDAHYLLAYGRALAVAAAKAYEADDVIQFSEAAKIAIISCFIALSVLSLEIIISPNDKSIHRWFKSALLIPVYAAL